MNFPRWCCAWLLVASSGFRGLSPAEEIIVAAPTNSTSARIILDFDRGWRFSRGDFANAMAPPFDDRNWSVVNVPHDWSSEGPFSADFASGNGYAPGGIGWYRKEFRLGSADRDRLVAVEFDGVYDCTEVWVNGNFVGGRPYGYASFECALTPYLRYGDATNVIAVRVDHSRFADSRWYTGSGIYRHVRLRLTDRLHIGQWGVHITTPEVTSATAVVRIETVVENVSGKQLSFSLQSELITPEGRVAGQRTTSSRFEDGGSQTLTQKIRVDRPQRWSSKTPALYTLRSRLRVGTTVVDETLTSFGVRSLRFDPARGFFLNDESIKIKGVCLHHDAGTLGAAVPEGVLERRLRTLKEIGVNAIRTSHNPPAPELLELCDRFGFLVMDEAFDEFTPSKKKWVTGRNNGVPARFGYAELFDQWSVTDLQDMVRRDRNHPSIILWSIGNEIDYANDPFSDPVLGADYHPENPPARELVRCTRPLIVAVKQLDTTRPVTAALATVAMSDAVGLPEMLDVVGYNYQEPRYAADHQKHPKRFIYGSETSHQLAAWDAVRTNAFVGGQFLWTGVDYLGEAGPWPNRGSGSGLLDLCGFKKPLAWFRQSLWTDQPMVYLCVSPGGDDFPMTRRRGLFMQEHWNWPSNELVNVRCYTTCPEVTLTLNDRPLGTRRRTEAVNGALVWPVPFEPGVLKAVGQKNGRPQAEFVLRTAGAASRIELLPDKTELRADGRDICHLEFRIEDDQGVRVPDATPEVSFTVAGPADLLGIENGDLNSPDNGKNGKRNAYHGRGLAILQSGTGTGRITVHATAPGLTAADAILENR